MNCGKRHRPRVHGYDDGTIIPRVAPVIQGLLCRAVRSSAELIQGLPHGTLPSSKMLLEGSPWAA